MSMYNAAGKMTTFVAVPLILALSVLGFLGIEIPFFTYIYAVALVFGAVLGIFDAFSEIRFHFKTLLFLLISLLMIIMGVNAFFMLPFVGEIIAIAMIPGLINLIVSIVLAVYLLIDAFTFV